MCGAPSIVSCSSMYSTISLICCLGVAELLQRHRHGLIHDLHQAAADELLVLHQRDVRFHAGRVAVHHEADRAGRRQHGGLGVAEAVLLAHLDDFVPHRAGRLHQVLRDVRLVDVLERRAVLPHHAQEWLAVLLVARERTAVIARDLGRLRVGGAVHHGRDGRRVVAAGDAVVGQAARHQQRAQVREPQPERTIFVAVLRDRRRRIARVVDQDLLRRDQCPARGFERDGIELAIVRRHLPHARTSSG